MFKKLPETKVMRDPIHEYIHIDLEIIYQCIQSDAFQRLRRIHQLGPTMFVYHTAEHSRFAHSLGVYEIARRMINEVVGLKEALNEFDQVALLCAALLHDIGHGPYSHTFEQLSGINHEVMSVKLIKSKQLNDYLSAAHPDLCQAVVDIINHKYHHPLPSILLSGQLDCDRMDYLLRDATFTGTRYGHFDLARLLRTMRIIDHKLVVKSSGMHAVEDYIMARYHMYWQVYYHPTARSMEALLKGFYKRLVYLYKHNQEIPEVFVDVMQGETMLVNAFLDFDESTFTYGLILAKKSTDKVLSDLARRILNRHVFAYQTYLDENQLTHIQSKLSEAGYDPEYYLSSDVAIQTPYKPYQANQQSVIYILTPENQVKELSQESTIVKAIVLGKEKEDRKIFFPKEVIHEL